MAYNNPPGLIAAAVIVQVIVFTFVTLRVIPRKQRGTRGNVSEWIILVATVGTTGLAVTQIYGVAAGLLGVPLGSTATDPAELQARYERIAKIYFSVVLISLVTSGLVKISVSFFYLKIFGLSRFRRIIMVWIGIVALWTVAWTILVLAQCGSHFLAFLNFAEAQKYCVSVQYMGLDVVLVVFPAVSDLITVLLPVPMIMTLQMPLKKRIGIVAIFMVGLLSVGASTAKAYMFIAARLGIETKDYGTLITFITTWSLIEVQVGTIAACAPTIYPVLHEIRRSSSGFLSSLVASASHLLSRSSVTDEPRTSKLDSIGSSEYSSTHRGSSGVGVKVDNSYQLADRSPSSSTSKVGTRG